MNTEDFYEEKEANSKNFDYFKDIKALKNKINAANHFRLYKWTIIV